MARVVLLAVFAALTVFYYYAMGPAPDAADLMEESLPWWKTRGWLTESLRFQFLSDFAREGRAWIPILAFLLPALGLWAGCLRASRDAVGRTLFLALLLTSGAFVVWGFHSSGSRFIWSYLGWRFPAVIATTGALIAVVVYAPSLLTRARRVSIACAAGFAAAFALLVFLLSTEVTGTDMDLPQNVSPWPFVNVVSLLYCGLSVAAVHIGAGAGAAIGQGRPAGPAIAAVVGGLLACALTPIALGAVLESGPTAAHYLSFLVLGAVDAAWLARVSHPSPTTATPGMRLAVGALCMAAIALSHQVGVGLQVHARNDTATRLLVALEAYKAQHDVYPDELEELVPAYLTEVPRPRIGLWLNEDDRFLYSSFGDSYALEFWSILWVQCQYSSPDQYAQFDDEEEDAEAGFEGESTTPPVGADDADPTLAATLADHGLGGSWACQERPPKFL